MSTYYRKTPRRGLSPAKNGVLRPLVKKAWLRQAVLHGWPSHDPQAERRWYEDQLETLTGCRSSTHVDWPPKAFDQALLHFATLAKDEAMIARATAGDERRMAYWIRSLLAELTYLENREVAWDYAVATYAHMTGFNLPLEDCPAQHLHPIAFALDTHVRQLLQERNQRQGLDWTRKDLRAAVAHMVALEAAYA